MNWRLASAMGLTVLVWLPFLGVLTSILIASAAGCRLDESGADPCIVLGVDIGGVLVFLFVLGWLMLVTLPFMLLSVLAWVNWGWRRWRSRRGRPT